MEEKKIKMSKETVSEKEVELTEKDLENAAGGCPYCRREIIHCPYCEKKTEISADGPNYYGNCQHCGRRIEYSLN